MGVGQGQTYCRDQVTLVEGRALTSGVLSKIVRTTVIGDEPGNT